jgi:membrane fusion protein (multidrug efflux system)
MLKNSYGFWWFPLVTLFLLISGCKDSRKEPAGSNSPKALTVAGVVIVPKALENRIMATGNLTANEEVELRSEVPGRIVAINFKEGTFVEKGSLLLKIDDRELQSQLKKLQVEEKQAKDDLYRKEKLL